MVLFFQACTIPAAPRLLKPWQLASPVICLDLGGPAGFVDPNPMVFASLAALALAFCLLCAACPGSPFCKASGS
jgi:hypothetical protein